MLNKVKKGIMVLGIAVLTGMSMSAHAEDEATAGKFSYGEVKTVAAGEIVISEYNYDDDQMVEAAYTINAETKINNFASVEEIKAGDEVEIEYAEVEGKKAALAISKAEEYEEGEEGAAAPASEGEAQEAVVESALALQRGPAAHVH